MKKTIVWIVIFLLEKLAYEQRKSLLKELVAMYIPGHHVRKNRSKNQVFNAVFEVTKMPSATLEVHDDHG